MTSSAAPARSEPVPVAEKILSTLDRFLHVEALSGIVLLIATAATLIWANSPAAYSYHEFWEMRVALSFGAISISQSVHFLVNDGLMTIFFLVVGLEIRREMHEGALATVRLAALPLAAALGGIDDIAAIVVIALFYSEGVRGSGLAIAALGMVLVILFQRTGIRSALAYVIPGVVVWVGALQSGVHPTLASVVLGLMARRPLRKRHWRGDQIRGCRIPSGTVASA